jgi:hypothetical protein
VPRRDLAFVIAQRLAGRMGGAIDVDVASGHAVLSLRPVPEV